MGGHEIFWDLAYAYMIRMLAVVVALYAGAIGSGNLICSLLQEIAWGPWPLLRHSSWWEETCRESYIDVGDRAMVSTRRKYSLLFRASVLDLVKVSLLRRYLGRQAKCDREQIRRLSSPYVTEGVGGCDRSSGWPKTWNGVWHMSRLWHSCGAVASPVKTTIHSRDPA